MALSFTNSQAVFLLVLWGILAFSFAQSSKKIIVGGSQNWRFGFNYSDWAAKNSPFHLHDTLVFKYDTTIPHSVYLLRDMESYTNCDLKRGKQIANTTQGIGEGFEFVLNQTKPLFFACGEHNGIHCNNGTMKFFVTPLCN